MKKHLFDMSKGMRRRPACDAVDDEALDPKEFVALGATNTCVECRAEYAAALMYGRTCQICGIVLGNSRERTDHISDHCASVVSYRTEPLAVLMDGREFYSSSSAKARVLAALLQALRRTHAGSDFEAIPSRLMLTKEGPNSSLLGEAHVVDYLIVQK